MNPELSYASHVPAASSEPEPKPKNFFSRLVGVLFSPGETFSEIGRAPRVLIPTLLFMILSGFAAYSITDRYGYENIVRKQMESMVNAGFLPAERAEEVIQQQLTPSAIARGKVQSAVAPTIVGLVILLVVAGLFKLYTLLMGSENRFKSVFSVTAYAFLAIGLISTAVMLLSIYLKDPSEIDMMNPIGSNLGALFSMMGLGLPKFVVGLASYVDVFGIWRLILLAIGYATVSRKMKTGTAAAFLIVLYIIGALIGAGMASMFG